MLKKLDKHEDGMNNLNLYEVFSRENLHEAFKKI